MRLVFGLGGMLLIREYRRELGMLAGRGRRRSCEVWEGGRALKVRGKGGDRRYGDQVVQLVIIRYNMTFREYSTCGNEYLNAAKLIVMS